ncbi:MAG TPA: tetratricopeptide repeat protein [Verrucomicrobiales bacterium]|nr:tetratricopeptide repeat protein [Verrucomicrobiales bacterium]
MEPAGTVRFGGSVLRGRAGWKAVPAAALAVSGWVCAGSGPEESGTGEVLRLGGEVLQIDPAAAGPAEERARIRMRHYHAQRLLEENRYEEALSGLEDVLRHEPANASVVHQTAWIYARFGRIADAERVLEAATEAAPDDPGLLLRWSEYWATFHWNEDSGKEKAVAAAEEAVVRFPDFAAGYDQLTGLLLSLSERDRAREVLQRRLEGEGGDALFWIRMARTAQRAWPLDLEEGEDRVSAPPEAINRFYERALQAEPDNFVVIDEVADFCSRSRQYERAAERYRRMIELRPQSLIAREKLARVYRILDRDDLALDALKELVRINPYRPKVQRLIARIHEERQELDLAVEHLEQALQYSEATPDEYGRLARLLLRLERVEPAVQVLRRARFLYPDSLDVRYLLAIGLGAGDRDEEAYGEFRGIVEFARESGTEEILDAEFYFQLGAAAEQARRFEEAAEAFRQSIRMAPDNAAQALNYLGYMWVEQDLHLEQAGQLLLRANELAPDNPAYIDSLGWHHFRMKQYDDALRELLRAESLLEQPDPVILDHIAQTLAALGRYREAAAYARRAVDGDPDEAPFQERLKDYVARETEAGDAGAPPETPDGEPGPDPDADGERGAESSPAEPES